MVTFISGTLLLVFGAIFGMIGNESDSKKLSQAGINKLLKDK